MIDLGISKIALIGAVALIVIGPEKLPRVARTVGTLLAAKAKPDGYTLLLNHIGLSTMPALYKKLAFDPLASFELIGLFAEGPMVILSRKEFGPKTFAELVSYAKANKEKVTFASSGMGSATHLCAMLFQEVWAYTFVPKSNLVDVHLSRLRRKLDAPGEPALIENIRGVGFRFHAPL